MAAVPSLKVSEATGVPPLQVALRHRNGLDLAWAPEYTKHTAFESLQDGGCMVYSKDGTLFAVATASNVQVFGSDDGKLVQTIPKAGCRNMFFSPQNTFMVTFERYQKTLTHGNISVWRLDTAEEVIDFTTKVNGFQRGTRWGPQWSDDEDICVYMFTNEIRIYDGKTLKIGNDNLRGRVRVPGLHSFQLSPGAAPYKVAVYIPEKKGAPALVSVYTLPELTKPTSTKGFFKVDEVQMAWNSKGTALLIGTHTEVDASGKSYYGDSKVHFLRADGEFETNVPLRKEGPVHSYQWSPNGNEFIVIHGTTPAKVILYNSRCEAKFDFGDAHRNEVRYSPHGRFVCIGGFGNMAGDMDFWDCNKKKKMGSASASLAHTYEWSPCGRYFMTSCLAPRMQVDHGFTIFSYNGEQVADERVDFLYEIIWRPAAADVYPDLPMSPRAEEKMKKLASAPPAAAATTQKYRPPGMRKMNVQLHEDVSVASKITADRKRPSAGGVAGLDEDAPKMSKSALKAKKKKEKKAAEAAKAAEAPEPATKEVKKPAAEDKPADPSTCSPEEIQKRVKQLKKKLRQISDLEEKATNGLELNSEQLAKVGGKKALEDELNLFVAAM